MYTRFFGLTQAPFSIAPDPRYLFMSQRHREALAHLVYGLQAGGGFVLLTGDIGSGKTTICRSLLQQTPPQTQLAYIFNPRLDGLELLQSICEEFRLTLPAPPHSIKALVDLLNEFLLARHAAGQRCVLIVDEAQNLGIKVLEQLRLLTNLETDEHKLLQIILIGQPELRDMLDQPALEQLAQRVIARYHLQALDPPDTRQYIEHRLRVAGLQGPLPFSAAALRRIHRLCGGVPRRINLLCDRALLGAYARRQPQVDVTLVNQASAEVLGRSPARGWRSPWVWAAVTAGAVAALAVAAGRSGPDTPSTPPTPSVQSRAAPDPQTQQPSNPGPAPAATVAAAPPANATASAPALGQLPDAQTPLWQALGRAWNTPLPDRDFCDAALAQGLQCFRTTQLTLAGLQQLNRPGLLNLRDGATARWVLLEALRDGHWQLRSGEQRWSVPAADLPRWWQGEYATLWRLPPGQRDRVFTAGPQDPAGRWLDTQLRRLQEQGQLAASTNDFTARVRAFQQQHRLHGDGKALPSTFLMANLLAGVPEPRLQEPPR